MQTPAFCWMTSSFLVTDSGGAARQRRDGNVRDCVLVHLSSYLSRQTTLATADGSLDHLVIPMAPRLLSISIVCPLETD